MFKTTAAGYKALSFFFNDLSRRATGHEFGGPGLWRESGGAAGSSLAEPLAPRIRRVAEGSNTITFVGSAAGGNDAPPDTVSWSQLHREAMAVAASLQARGVKPGDHVALMGPTTRPLVTAIQGIWLAGGCVLMLPLPMRLASREEFMLQTSAHISHGEASLVLLDPVLALYLDTKDGDPPVALLDQVQPGPGRPTAADYKEVPDDPHRLAILQFTSGSTAEPKGVMLPHHVIGANIDGMVQAAEIEKEDIMFSWLPLYHDMGLIGLLTVSMTVGCNLVLTAPQDFLAKPGDWLRWMHEFKATITAGPNFSWVLATRALKRFNGTESRLDLSSIRLALNGAEPVDPDAVDKFVDEAEPHHFRPGAVFCAFGMAEVAIAGSFPPLMRGMACDYVDRIALEKEGVARPADPKRDTTRRLTLLGRPILGLEMRICDPVTGEELGQRMVGELEIRGTSVTTGYYNRPELSDSLFHDGWLRSGDLAYLVGGPDGGPPELVICGRIKDMIIISGRNVFPEDLERAIGALDDVRAGNVIAFGVEGSKGKENIVVVAEVRTEKPLEVRRAIRSRVIDVCAAPPRDIVLVQPGTLPKTSSGKLQRSLCRKRYLAKELTSIGG